MPHAATNFDFIIIGAGSAGCAVAGQLARKNAGSIAIVEAGPSDNHWRVKMPFGLNWLIGSNRDWKFKSSPQAHAAGREINIPRGKMVGGSGSINSMVWLRGLQSDYDNWKINGWAWRDIEPLFEKIERQIKPEIFSSPHALTRKLCGLFGTNDGGSPKPDYESSGIFSHNMRDGKRCSAADAFLRPYLGTELTLLTGLSVNRIGLKDQKANKVHFSDGSYLTARKGIILSAGTIGSTKLLLNSGIGPKDDLKEVVLDEPRIGKNLHDHPGCGIHFEGRGTGYGLTIRQSPVWATAPFRYLTKRTGPFASPTVEGGMFFNAEGKDATPNVQSHFIPFLLNHRGPKYTYGQGYFADVCLCRPKSRGALRKTSTGFDIDFNLLSDPADLDVMVAGIERLRELLFQADLGGDEVFPGKDVKGSDLINHIKKSCGTAYHPVGTIALGGPIDERCKVKNLDGLWVADASIMPNITSANTNAPSIMIGYKAGEMIAKDFA